MANHGFGETPIGLVSQILNLASILTRPIVLRIPPFQRPYTWTEKEVSQLIFDLLAAYERRASLYFIGQMVFVRAGRDYADVCDGQQRLITLTMLLAHARDLLQQHEQVYQALIMKDAAMGRLHARATDAAFFSEWVQAPGRMRDLVRLTEFQTDAQHAMANAARVISKLLADMSARDLDAFVRYIARCAVFNVIDADEIGSAATVFEAMNHRGQPLSGADILKGALLASRELTLEEGAQGAEIWEEYEDKMGRENFQRLLNYIPMLVRSGPIIAAGDIAALVEGISKRIGVKNFLFDVLPAYCQAHHDIIFADLRVGPHSDEVNRLIRCLQIIDDKSWEPLAIAYLVARGGHPPEALRFFQLFERYIWAAHLNVVQAHDHRLKNLPKLWKIIGDDKALYEKDSPLMLDLQTRSNLLDRMSLSTKNYTGRREIVLRVNACFGEALARNDDFNVEHILPQRSNRVWTTIFRDPKTYSTYANMLGNMALIRPRQNTLCGSKSYPEKRAVYFNGKDHVCALTRDIEPIEDWNPRAVEERQERLCEKINAEWRLV